MKRNYTRFSLPSRMIELLYSDDEFFRYVLKDKKAKESTFPKYNTYIDEEGFHMLFALAGYSSKDVSVEFYGNEIIISSNGIQDEITDESDDTTDGSLERAKQSVQRGYIVRGIARRRFSTKFQVINLFDLSKATAQMKDGELHIIIPEGNMMSGSINVNYVSGEE